MKVSELIEALQAAQSKAGDIEVRYQADLSMEGTVVQVIAGITRAGGYIRIVGEEV